MKKIAIFCRSFKMGVEPFTSDYYWQAYQDLFFALKAHGVEPYFATDNNTYKDYGVFETLYTIDAKTDITNLKPVHDVKVDLVFDRGGFIGRNVLTINPPILQKIGMDKAEMYKHFAEFQPFSVVCHTRDELITAFEQMSGGKVVVKEPKSFGGGKDVYIGNKADVLSQIRDKYPLLVQEFFDTAAGVPGHMTGVHDVRLSVCGGKIIGYYIRKAKDGSLHSNVSRGGSMIFFDVAQVPPELKEIVEDIDILFARQPRYYSIDFMCTPVGWKMLEINPLLALVPITDGKEVELTLNRLADYLAATCDSHKSRLAKSPEFAMTPTSVLSD